MILSELITAHASDLAAAKKWDDVATLLSEENVVVRNPKSWTMADLVTLLGPEQAALVCGTIQAAGASNPIFAGAWLALNITGLQLHTEERQGMIQMLATAGGWSAELTAAALAAGVTHTSLAGHQVTAEECRLAQEATELERDWATVQNEFINPAVGNRVERINALKYAVAFLEAGPG